MELLIEDNNFGDLEELLKNIRNEVDGNIKKNILEAFLENGKDFVIKRLGLIRIIMSGYNPEEVYKKKLKLKR